MAAKKSAIDLKLIRDLAELLNETDLSEIEIEEDEIRIRLARGGVVHSAPVVTHLPAPAPAVSHPPAAAAAAEPEAEKAPSGTPVPSPMVGTAYLAPAPGADDFVKIGDTVKAGQTIMIVEAMKTMNHVPSTKDGVVKKILVTDGEAVEFDQDLILVE